MGDMKTPDFDDLLAAFDIPDATSLDAKENIQESHDEAEGQLKHTGMCMDDSLSVHQAVGASDVPAVSVIVKNTSRQESSDSGGEREGPHFGHPLQNGFRGSGAAMESHQIDHSGSKSFVSALNGGGSRGLLGKTPVQHKLEGTPSFSQSFSQFSPISSPESEDSRSNGVDIRPKQERPYFPAASIFMSAEPPMSDNQKKQLSYSMFDKCHEVDCDVPENLPRSKGESIKAEDTRTEKPDSNVSDQKVKGDCHSSAMLLTNDHNNIVSSSNVNIVAASNMPTSHPCVKTPTSKLSSCLEALVALNARKDPSEQPNYQDLSLAHDDNIKVSPKVPMSPQSPRSPLEAVKRLMKPPDSPVSICSNSSGKGSPALASGSPPAIPRVRIKTIKTTTGQIQRTVTSVVPDSENEDVHSVESSPSQSMIVEDAYPSLSPYPSHNVISDIIVDMPIKSTPVGALPSKVTDTKLEGNSKRPGQMQSATIFHNTSSPVMRSMPVAQHGPSTQKRISSVQTGNSPNTSLLPKAMHLANLNLVPHSVAASVAARSTSHQQSQQHTLSSSMVCSTVPLVHQVKKAAPNPRAAIPSTAAGTLNRLLNNANPVPTYVPNLNPPPESNINLPPRGYCCLECGDSFGVERSLVYHYGRRSVHIEVACTHCAKTMVFFNKCALLAHAREHKNKGVVMQCTQLSMKPIAEGQMFAPLITESSVHVGSHVPPLSSPKSQPVMPLYPDKVIRHRLRCLECNKQLSDYKGLAGHYQRLSEEMEGLMCKVCSMLLPNKCSYRAHQRIHAHKSPYCCPECGALSRSVDIQKHVKENCLHYARKAGYKCLHCDMVFMSFNVQKSHIEEKHCEVFYKCTICPVAFKSSGGCEMHLTTKHNASKVSPQLIFKCSCETVFKKKQLLLQHFYQNAKKRATCVFKCPECTSIFTQKQPLMQHFKGVHGGIFKEEVEKSTKPPEMTAQHQDVTSGFHQPKVNTPIKYSDGTRKRANLGARDSKPNLKNAGWNCGECLHWLPDREAYVSHMKKNHGRSLKSYPCRQCERSFNSSTSLRRHIRNDHDGKKNTFTCWYCTDERTTFTTNILLKNHISLMHGIKNPDFSLLKSAPLDSSKALGEVIFLLKGPVSKRPAVESEGEGQEGAALEGSPAKRLKHQFRCSKCGFTTEDGTQFQKHIPQHKTDENTPQCLHCGLCFASQLSLNRHLFIVHKVKEPEEERKERMDMEYECRKKQEEDVGKAVGVNEREDLPPPLVKSDPQRAEDPTRLHCEPAVRLTVNPHTAFT
ncbi:zinc finger protein 592 isoform X1 [Oncorhynchus mykiss]|uniref:zinc finger protein 592 isoform X1 n=1 Tax=Oncorhynchus mykiss TaxID=8022 RepID=UPI001878E73F|nr:zinc finger protein 592 isoform X1 [Oncorhynchus mykiss]XP_036811064.1 zinc finger protein 592 isoform X1 [Oncorhynchus mykiss]